MFHSIRSFGVSRATRGALALAALATVGALDVTPASAQGAWCAQYSGKGGGATNCGFYTLEQCRLAVSGVGGFCSPSPWAFYPDQQPVPRKLRRPHY
jgi:Protein of unknown function (DUF3551)